MHRIGIDALNNELIKEHILFSLRHYWTQNKDEVLAIPIQSFHSEFKIDLPLKLRKVVLPNWAKHFGVDGCLLVPGELIPANRLESDLTLWREIDWWLAIFLFLECVHERQWEALHGSIHSYSFRLKGWDSRAWEYAWVNRIAMFMREWATHQQGKTSKKLLGDLPAVGIYMTHDVDAVNKTVAIRIKQASFIFINAVIAIFNGRKKSFVEFVKKFFRLAFGYDDWWGFDKIIFLEKKAGIKSTFHFHVDFRPKSIKRWLLDPGYDVRNPKLKRLFKNIIDEGHEIGLHPSFDAWKSSEILLNQKLSLEDVLGQRVNSCRQHWLRFSWGHTWRAQEVAT